jgi:hypothetical protein
MQNQIIDFLAAFKKYISIYNASFALTAKIASKGTQTKSDYLKQ